MQSTPEFQPPTTYTKNNPEEVAANAAHNAELDSMKMPPCPWCVSEEKRTKRRACSMHPNGDFAPPPARTSPFSWASVAGADPEPVEVTEFEGRPCVYTLGCADPFFLDDPSVLLYADEMERPKNLKTQAEVDELEAQWRRRAGKRHSWRGPR